MGLCLLQRLLFSLCRQSHLISLRQLLLLALLADIPGCCAGRSITAAAIVAGAVQGMHVAAACAASGSGRSSGTGCCTELQDGLLHVVMPGSPVEDVGQEGQQPWGLTNLPQSVALLQHTGTQEGAEV